MAEAPPGSIGVLIALIAAAGIAQAAPDPAPGVRSGVVGAVVEGQGQGAQINEPRYRLAGRPAWGRPPQACTVVAGDGNTLWQPSGCVYVAAGWGNVINGRMFGPDSLVCIGQNRRPKLCKRHPVLDRLPQVHLPRLPFGG